MKFLLCILTAVLVKCEDLIAKQKLNYRLTEDENQKLQNICGKAPGGTVLTNKTTIEAPWAVYLSYAMYDRKDIRRVHLAGNFVLGCTGTLISSRHVITAAHCIDASKANCDENRQGLEYKYSNVRHWRAFMGGPCAIPKKCQQLHQRTQLIERTISKILIPRNFTGIICDNSDSPMRLEDDFAIFVLSEDVPFSSNLYPACLSTQTPNIGTKLNGFGYGLNPLYKTSSKYKYGILKGLDWQFAKCQDRNYPEQICVLAPHGILGCKGDSGHGLIHKSDDKSYLLGVYSSGMNCQKTLEWVRQYPEDTNVGDEVFMNVPSYLPFICQMTGICTNGLYRTDEGRLQYTILN